MQQNKVYSIAPARNKDTKYCTCHATRRTTAKKRPTVTGDPKRTVTSEPHYHLVFTAPQTSRSPPWLSEASAANLASRDCICCCALSDSWACRRAGHFHRFRSSEQILQNSKNKNQKQRGISTSHGGVIFCGACVVSVVSQGSSCNFSTKSQVSFCFRP